MTTPQCPYCKTAAELVSSYEVYGRDYGNIWRCKICGAMVGCHRGTSTPLGTLANDVLRRWRVLAHRHIDWIWRSGKMSRKAVYARLARELGVHPSDCHIGLFDESTCKQIVEMYKGYK